MEGGGAQGGAGSGGPAPFLLKTYDMVDDSSTDEIVSWSSNNSSFVVWNAPEFSRLLLPTYFKHNNFSSFIRQLNTYGFRKIDPERWEFSNDEFVKGKKHLLKSIHRRKPIHSHSNPPPSSGSDPERASFEEEIERLSREKTTFEADLWRFRNQYTGTKSQLEELERRVKDMEQRQQKMLAFLRKASKSPVFVEHLVRMAGGSSIDFSVLSNKRRQLPRDGAERGQERIDNRPSDDYSSSSKASEFGFLFPQDFTSKLKLELSPAVSDGNLVSLNTQSSDEGAESPRGMQLDGIQLRTACLSFVPEVAELMDTGASLCPRKNLPLPWQAGAPDEADGNISCHLNLTLASCPLQFEKSLSTEKKLNSTSQDIDCVAKLRSNTTHSERDFTEVVEKDKPNASSGDAKEASLQEPVTANNPVTAPATGKNDVFWEQFLTERPGSSDTEEASSRLRSNPQEERHEGGNDTSWCSRKGIEKLSL